jgi:hypothetical protein
VGQAVQDGSKRSSTAKLNQERTLFRESGAGSIKFDG